MNDLRALSHVRYIKRLETVIAPRVRYIKRLESAVALRAHERLETVIAFQRAREQLVRPCPHFDAEPARPIINTRIGEDWTCFLHKTCSR